MAERSLVKEDIDAGADLIRLLDDEGFAIRAAAWLHSEDDEAWHLLIGSDLATHGLQDAYYRLSLALSTRPKISSRIETSRIRFVPPSDVRLGVLGRALKPGSRKPVRISNSAFEGVYIDDAVVYRAAA